MDFLNSFQFSKRVLFDVYMGTNKKGWASKVLIVRKKVLRYIKKC